MVAVNHGELSVHCQFQKSHGSRFGFPGLGSFPINGSPFDHFILLCEFSLPQFDAGFCLRSEWFVYGCMPFPPDLAIVSTVLFTMQSVFGEFESSSPVLFVSCQLTLDCFLHRVQRLLD